MHFVALKPYLPTSENNPIIVRIRNTYTLAMGWRRYVCLNIAPRLALVFLRVWCLFAFGVGPSRRVRWFRFSALLVGRSARVVVSYRFFLFGNACWSTHAKIGKFAL